jgi:hypothetical protein
MVRLAIILRSWRKRNEAHPAYIEFDTDLETCGDHKDGSVREESLLNLNLNFAFGSVRFGFEPISRTEL